MLPLLVQGLSQRAVSAMQRGLKHLIFSVSFVKERSLEGRGMAFMMCYSALSSVLHGGGTRERSSRPGKVLRYQRDIRRVLNFAVPGCWLGGSVVLVS